MDRVKEWWGKFWGDDNHPKLTQEEADWLCGEQRISTEPPPTCGECIFADTCPEKGKR